MILLSIQEKAAKLVDIPGWVAWDFEVIENGLLCRGAVCPEITRGKNKGHPNYRKADKSTMRTVVIPKGVK